MSTESDLYVRKASGLVKTVTTVDAMLMMISQISIGACLLTMAIDLPRLYPGGDFSLSMIFMGLLLIPLIVMYVQLLGALPRTGGDYIYTTRILGIPWLGFANNLFLVIGEIVFTAMWFNWISTWGLSSIFTYLGILYNNPAWLEWATFFASREGALIIGTMAIVYWFVVMSLGTKVAFRVNFVLILIGTMGMLAFMVLLGMTSSTAFIQFFNDFTKRYASYPTDYQSIIQKAAELGFEYPTNILWTATIASLPYAIFSYWGNFGGIWWAGEVKKPVRSILIGALGATFYGMFFYSISLYLAGHVAGWPFLGSIAFLSGTEAYPFKVSPSLLFLTSVISAHPAVLTIIFISFLAWLLSGPIAFLMVATRSIFAWSFDRLIPDFFSDINPRFNTPVKLHAAIGIITFICLLIYTYTDWLVVVSASTLLFMPSILPSITAMLLKKLRRDIYESAHPITKVEIHGIPIISLMGAVSAIILVWLAYLVFSAAALTPEQIIFLVSVFIAGVVIYAISYIWNKGRGIDLNLVYKTIPPA
jgi:amino acid transporter